MSSSTKLFKPNYSSGACKSNFSESHEKEYISESNYVDSSWAGNGRQLGYSCQARENQMGRSMRNFVDGVAINSSNYFAQAQSAQPSPTINVVQTADGLEGWAKKPNYMSGQAQASKYGLAVHREEHMMGKAAQGWTNKPTHNTAMGLGNEYGMTGNQRMMVVHEEDHVEEKVESKLVSNPTPFTDRTRADQYGKSQLMYKEQQSDGVHNYSEAGVENSWANKLNKHLGRTQSIQSMQGMHKDHQGWANSPTKYLGSKSNIGQRPNSPTNSLAPIETNNSGFNMYKDQHIMGQSDHVVLVNPPTQSPTSIQGKKYNGGWADQPVKHLGAVQVGYSGNMYNEQGQHGFGGSQVNHSAHESAQNRFGSAQSSYAPHGVAHNKFESGQANYSTHIAGPDGFEANGVGSTHHSAYGATQNGFGSTQANYLAYGATQNGVGSAQASHSAYGATQIGFGSVQSNNSEHDVTENGVGSAQAIHPVYGATQTRFGSAQANCNAQSAYNYHDHEEADEDVHEIMDEILAKYPAHNVSGGKPNTYMHQNQGGRYAQQQSFVGQPHQGILSQSSSNKFEMKYEAKAGYLGNTKKEFSHSSSSNKFEANGVMINNGGGTCNNRIETDVDCDF